MNNEQRIFRTNHNKENPYVQISNKVVVNKENPQSELSPFTLGIFAKILFYQDTSIFHPTVFFKKYGRKLVEKAINELIEKGHCHKVKINSKVVKFYFFENPDDALLGQHIRENMMYSGYNDDAPTVHHNIEMMYPQGNIIENDVPTGQLSNTFSITKNINHSITSNNKQKELGIEQEKNEIGMDDDYSFDIKNENQNPAINNPNPIRDVQNVHLSNNNPTPNPIQNPNMNSAQNPSNSSFQPNSETFSLPIGQVAILHHITSSPQFKEVLAGGANPDQLKSNAQYVAESLERIIRIGQFKSNKVASLANYWMNSWLKRIGDDNKKGLEKGNPIKPQLSDKDQRVKNIAGFMGSEQKKSAAKNKAIQEMGLVTPEKNTNEYFNWSQAWGRLNSSEQYDLYIGYVVDGKKLMDVNPNLYAQLLKFTSSVPF